MEKISVSAPGRVCLFGEHQDYLGLPVIPCAINLRNRITGHTTTDGVFSVSDLRTGSSGSFKMSNLHYVDDDFDYMRAVVKVMIDDGHSEITGACVEMKSNVPVRSGLSSSAALLVAWAKFLDEGFHLGYDPVELGMVCYRAEREELEIPCGMMDQLSSSLGRIAHIDCRDTPEIRRLPADINGLVVGDTFVHKKTLDVHSVRTREMGAALNKFGELRGRQIDIRMVEWDEVEDLIPRLGKVSTMRLRAAIMNRDITSQATDLLSNRHPDHEEVGRLLSEHQKYLRDDYEVSHPRIEKLLSAGTSAGALGGKLTGAGLGGCVVLLAPGCQEDVAEAIRMAGGVPYIVSVDEGARRE